jgi:hypothetical protein
MSKRKNGKDNDQGMKPKKASQKGESGGSKTSPKFGTQKKSLGEKVAGKKAAVEMMDKPSDKEKGKGMPFGKGKKKSAKK